MYRNHVKLTQPWTVTDSKKKRRQNCQVYKFSWTWKPARCLQQHKQTRKVWLRYDVLAARAMRRLADLCSQCLCQFVTPNHNAMQLRIKKKIKKNALSRLYSPSDTRTRAAEDQKNDCGTLAVSRGIVGSVGISKVNTAREAAGGEI